MDAILPESSGRHRGPWPVPRGVSDRNTCVASIPLTRNLLIAKQLGKYATCIFICPPCREGNKVLRRVLAP